MVFGGRRSKATAAGVAIVLASAFGIIPATAASAAAPAASPAAVHQVAASALDVTGDGFVGEISDPAVSVVDGDRQLTGTTQGVLDGQDVEATSFTTVIESVQANASCTILDLDLGPLDLDLLGLVVELDEVNLDITTVPGAGNLLGNLLCAEAGLLDRGGPLTAISALLNRL